MSGYEALPWLEYLHETTVRSRAEQERELARGDDIKPRAASLLRPIRRLPPLPTQAMLKRALDKYGIRRRTGAAFMGVSDVTFDRYCLPLSSKHRQRIPLLRWTMFLIRIKAMHHPEEDIEL